MMMMSIIPLALLQTLIYLLAIDLNKVLNFPQSASPHLGNGVDLKQHLPYKAAVRNKLEHMKLLAPFLAHGPWKALSECWLLCTRVHASSTMHQECISSNTAFSFSQLSVSSLSTTLTCCHEVCDGDHMTSQVSCPIFGQLLYLGEFSVLVWKLCEKR